MYLVINKCVTAVKVSNFSGHYLRNRSHLDIGVLGYIGIVQHKEHSPEVWHIPPGTFCICIYKNYVISLINASTNGTIRCKTARHGRCGVCSQGILKYKIRIVNWKYATVEFRRL